jgi:hypothetical protein
MHKTFTLAVILFCSACGGTSPELYHLVVSYFTLPDSCYTNSMAPTTATTAAPPDLLQVQVWDGPDNIPYLQVIAGGTSVDMGAAPNVDMRGIFTGKRADKGGWTFSSDTAAKATVAGNTVNSTTHAELNFERGGGSFKGTAALSSSQTCTGAQCPASSPSCSVGNIALQGSRIAVEYQKAP